MNIFSLQYWFAVSPPPFRTLAFNILLALFILLVISGIVVKILGVKAKLSFSISRVFKKVSRPLFSTGLIGLLLLFFESERIVFLRSRFWYILLFGWLVYLTVRFFQYVLRQLPAEREQFEKKKKFEKYLPH